MSSFFYDNIPSVFLTNNVAFFGSFTLTLKLSPLVVTETPSECAVMTSKLLAPLCVTVSPVLTFLMVLFHEGLVQ